MVSCFPAMQLSHTNFTELQINLICVLGSAPALNWHHRKTYSVKLKVSQQNLNLQRDEGFDNYTLQEPEGPGL